MSLQSSINFIFSKALGVAAKGKEHISGPVRTSFCSSAIAPDQLRNLRPFVGTFTLQGHGPVGLPVDTILTPVSRFFFETWDFSFLAVG